MSVGRLYTGSAADYEKPSLLKVGTGEGSQVYGWGLYASSERGVAESYLPPKDQIERANQYREYLKRRIAEETDPHEKEYLEFNLKEAEKARPTQSVYEQTFFTNRAPGDESHLLKWYDKISPENAKRVISAIESLGISEDHLFSAFGNDWRGKVKERTGQDAYQMVQDCYRHFLDSDNEAQAASELLAKFDIDGVKYPVDSFGKTVKDGDKAGWNYVSFRDDNINVDHKWRDGEALFSVGNGRPIVNKSLFVAGRARVADPADWGEQTPGALAASSELSNQGVTPMSSCGAIRKMSLPLPLLEFLRKKVVIRLILRPFYNRL